MLASGRDNVPDVIAIVAFSIARLLVVLPEIERLALVSPLLAAVVACDNSPVTGVLRIARNHQRRPVDGALTVAGRLVRRGVAVIRIEGHSLGVDQHLAFRRIADLGGFGGLGERKRGAKRQHSTGDHGSEDLLHDRTPWLFRRERHSGARGCTFGGGIYSRLASELCGKTITLESQRFMGLATYRIGAAR